jgi:hypothetical protein
MFARDFRAWAADIGCDRVRELQLRLIGSISFLYNPLRNSMAVIIWSE